jgi:hypothetical protein
VVKAARPKGSISVSVRRVLESYESCVIQVW